MREMSGINALKHGYLDVQLDSLPPILHVFQQLMRGSNMGHWLTPGNVSRQHSPLWEEERIALLTAALHTAFKANDGKFEGSPSRCALRSRLRASSLADSA